MIEFKYRPEVDGLRAVAVLLVLLFHAGLGFSGGYIGVDVFFVISGFLITGLILKEQHAGKFKLSEFWARRIRRIIPASALVLTLTLLAGMVLLLPRDLQKLAQSTFAQQLFSANIYFYLTVGYFEGPAELKPLLHTWSLAVEEQFYFIYPFLLFFTRNLSRKALAFLLSLLALASLALSAWGVYAHPEATFFLLPARAWELLLGGLLCFATLPRQVKAWQVELLSGVGLAAILASGWLYSHSTHFPGLAALAPCVGTALIIYANSDKLTFSGRFLATRPVVFVGLISYSLYLWHWPILAYLRYWLGDVLPLWVRLTALAASFGLAYLSWRFVETPFRKPRQDAPRWRPYVAAAVVAAVLLTVSIAVDWANGLPQRFSQEALRFAVAQEGVRRDEFSRDTIDVLTDNLPVIGDTSLPADRIDCVIWGDSHAMALGSLCDALAEEHGLRCVIAARSGTVPLLDVWRPAVNKEALDWNNAVLDFIASHNVKHVILVARWSVNIEGEPSGRMDTLIADSQSTEASRAESKKVLQRGLQRTLDQLAELGVQTWVLEQVPYQGQDPNRQLALAAIFQMGTPQGTTLEEHLARQANATQVFAALTGEGFTLLDPTPYCFDAPGNSRLADSEKSFYSDQNHLSPHGTETLLRPLLEPVFSEIAREDSVPTEE